MSKPPASVNKGLLISASLPGMGEAYHGNVSKGIRILIEYLAAIILSIFTSRIFFPDGPIFVHILHAA